MNDQAQVAIESMVGQAVKQSREEIIKIVGAVFGKFGHLQSDIPEVMRRAGVKNPAVSVLGWGDWLKDNGLSGLQEMISNMNPKIVRHHLYITHMGSDTDLTTRTKPSSGKWPASTSAPTSSYAAT